MDTRLSNKLIQDFPALFIYTIDMLKWQLPILGFNFHSGWFPILYGACEELDRLRIEFDFDFQLFQAKKVSGELRIYHNGPPAAQDVAFNIFCVSQTVCEICGEPGIKRRKKTIETRCDFHIATTEEADELVLKKILDDALSPRC